MSTDWNNWSANQQHRADKFELPTDEESLAELLARAELSDTKVRVIGSGHSFVPFWTDDTLVSLDNMKGLVSCDPDTGQATFWAGTKLYEMGEPLWQLGFSMENMGDIDRQTIAGAISTGTHGTGRTLQNIPSQLRRIRLLRADGDVVEMTPGDDELFRAAQVSMGTLGVITKATFQLQPAYYMHEKNWTASVNECAATREELARNNRHWEFFWDPGSDTCAMKTLNITDRREEVRLNELEIIGRSYQIIPSTRDFKFNEIEFSLPADAGWECFLDIRELMKTRFKKVRWPLEYRTLKADTMLLSSASLRDSVTISAHEGQQYPYETFFSAIEDIFRQYDGRPHWGKVHSLVAGELRHLLPHFDQFCEIRRQFDPRGRFLNSFLKGIFGVD